MMNKYALPTVLIYQHLIPSERAGGAEFHTCIAIDALKNHCRLTLLTQRRPDWKKVNELYGTNIDDDDLEVAILPPRSYWRKLVNLYAKYGPLNPKTRADFANYDLSISFGGHCNFCKPGIHFLAGLPDLKSFRIAVPKDCSIRNARYFCDEYFKPFLRFLLYPKSHSAYLDRCIANGDRFIANSRWIAAFFKEYHYNPTVVYPPVFAEFQPIAFEDQKPNFVSLGRVARVKRVEDSIKILDGVRKKTGMNFDFHIAGDFQSKQYGQFLRKLTKDKPWVIFDGPTFGENKQKLLTSNRYALSTCQVEAFGITVAEYLKAGCIPFVYEGSGSAELYPMDDLKFRDIDDGVSKIARFLTKTQEEQKSVREKLLIESRKFATSVMIDEMKRVIQEELDKRGFEHVL